MNKTVRSVVAALVMSSMAIGSAIQPARADTTTTLLITAAAAVGLMTAVNVAQKNTKAHQVVGYLPTGATVYADGHVVNQNGQSWYPGNYGENIACNGQQCYITGAANGTGYAPNGAPGYGQTGYPAGYGQPGYQQGYPSGYGQSGYPGGYGGYPSGYGAGYPSGYGSSYPAGYGSYPAGYGSYPAGYGSYPAGYGSYPAGYGSGYPSGYYPPPPAPPVSRTPPGTSGNGGTIAVTPVIHVPMNHTNNFTTTAPVLRGATGRTNVAPIRFRHLHRRALRDTTTQIPIPR